jgi:hypothetical protein
MRDALRKKWIWGLAAALATSWAACDAHSGLVGTPTDDGGDDGGDDSGCGAYVPPTCPAGPTTCDEIDTCPSGYYCREEVAGCAGYPGDVNPRYETITTACCRPFAATCMTRSDCGPLETCGPSWRCEPFPDNCNGLQPRCAPGCHWDEGPCACICSSPATCPPAHDGG